MFFSRHTRRREFIAGLGSAAAWPLAARAQQSEGMRRIGVLMSFDENDPVWKPRLSAFTQALADLGWTDGRKLRIDLRWAGGDANRMRALARELVSLQPEIILTNTTPATVALQRETRTIPIVFTTVADPVASGTVARLDQPGGNDVATGSRLLRTHCVPDQPAALGHDTRKFGNARLASDDSEGEAIELVELDCRGRQWTSLLGEACLLLLAY
jgi:hypothetical protein